jgi:hypothetical protein
MEQNMEILPWFLGLFYQTAEPKPMNFLTKLLKNQIEREMDDRHGTCF